ncbi:hypothetical protein DPMN_137608 [Dreissena polymorpha]|uniref:Uncharacterized protein n=1 Tax=Dreissena polymorpha TaxID=45954 RepID=A0A9D4G324_DREPO|nr:hypothetical protein DPMN_137608 [Dreissena polymorpha]
MILQVSSTQFENLCRILEIQVRTDAIPPVPRRPWPPTSGLVLCPFCKRNGERRSIYTSHNLKGNV